MTAIAQPAHAPFSGNIDYTPIIEDKKRQDAAREAESKRWLPMVEAMLQRSSGLEPHQQVDGPLRATADVLAAGLSDEALLFLPAGGRFTPEVAPACSPTTGAPGFDADRVLVRNGEATSFALNQQTPICQSASFQLVADGGSATQDIELTFAPEIGRCADGGCSMRGVKGEIRLGESDKDADGDKRGWYVFAGADGTVVVWDERPSGIAQLRDAIDVRETLTMGDIEAGIMLNRGKADVSLSFVHRRSKFQTWDTKVVDNEDFVGVKVSFD